MDIEMIASLGLGSAEQLADRALAAASEAGVKICVAVVDRAGYPLVFKRHPGAPFHSIDIALDKPTRWSASAPPPPNGTPAWPKAPKCSATA